MESGQSVHLVFGKVVVHHNTVSSQEVEGHGVLILYALGDVDEIELVFVPQNVVLA